MGEENPIRKPGPENRKNRLDARGDYTSAGSSSVGGESTVDGSESGAAAARAESRICIGPYVPIRKLGEGGMGQVWLAEQTAPVKRQVALKLIKGGLYDTSVLQRFEAERQSLALMNHPAIAKVFDAGSTKDGQPYFVMEYVDGLPITRYCDNQKLKIRERLELIIKVCEGVQHAHQKAIIHRDLKPSNILVVDVDGKPTPRIIDFGIAKAISSQPGADQTQFTEMGVLIGTRGFMSPEQSDPTVFDVDTRADVYSLGALLYVLLTGTLPFDLDGEKKKPLDEILRQLREEDPPSPSTKINREKDTATAAALTRGTDTKQLAKLLRGDLDWITMKAVEKDRTRRYATPSELAADLARYLENRPVLARPASAGYRLKKYVQRHRLGAATAAGVAALLVAFAINQALQLRRITRERDRANRITDFMTGMFTVSNPSEARGNTITAREVLDKASTQIETGLTKDPESQAQMMRVMGSVYSNLGLYPRAESLFRRAIDIARPALGPEHPDSLWSLIGLAYVLQRQGHYPEAEKLDREALDTSLRALGPQHRVTIAAMNDLAITLTGEGHYPEAEKLQRQVLDVRRRLLGLEHPDTVASINNVANVLLAEGRYAEAEKLLREALGIQRRALGPEHPETQRSMYNLAYALSEQHHYAEAEKLDRETLDIRRRVLGPEHPDTLGSIQSLAIVVADEGRSPEAEKLDRELLDIRRRVLGLENPDTLSTQVNLADIIADQERYPEAERLLRDALAIQRRVLGPENPHTLDSEYNLATVLDDEGHYAEAEELERVTLDIRRRVLGPDHPDTLKSIYDLACYAARNGRRDEALALIREAINHGYQNPNLQTDTDLQSLHGDPRFVVLVADAKRPASDPQKPK